MLYDKGGYMKSFAGNRQDKLAELPNVARTGASSGYRASSSPDQFYNVTATSMRRAAAAARNAVDGVGVCNIAMVGDSRYQGAGVTAPGYLNSVPGLVRQALQAVRSGGTGTIHFLNNAIPATVGSGPYPDPRITFQANGGSISAANSFNYGLFNNGTYAFSNGAGFTFVCADCDALDIFAMGDNGNGNVTVTVDGGTPVTYAVNSRDGANAGNNYKRIPAGSRGAHTFVVTSPAASNTYIWGVAGVIEGSGFRVSSLARSGYDITQLDQANPQFWGSLDVAFITPRPDLVTFDLALNSYQSQLSPRNFKTRTINAVKRAKETADVLLITSTPRDQTEAGYDSATKPISLRSYNRIYYEIADAYDCAVLDMDGSWSTFQTVDSAPYDFYSDTLHWNDRGSKDVANRIIELLGVGAKYPISGVPA